jgi:hypothetical protein
LGLRAFRSRYLNRKSVSFRSVPLSAYMVSYRLKAHQKASALLAGFSLLCCPQAGTAWLFEGI